MSTTSTNIPQENKMHNRIGLTRSLTCGGFNQYCGHPQCPDNTQMSNNTIHLINEAFKPIQYTSTHDTSTMILSLKEFYSTIGLPMNSQDTTNSETLPRRSKRIAKMPPKTYFSPEDEMIDIEEALITICNKKGWIYSDTFLEDFYAWLPTAPDWATMKYDYLNERIIPFPKTLIAKNWAMYYSSSITKQKEEIRFNKAIINYCNKHGYLYNYNMITKFSEWMNDPVNKSIITYTYPPSSFADMETNTYNRPLSYCVNKWFATLKKKVLL
jgi:hypothetical protein